MGRGFAFAALLGALALLASCAEEDEAETTSGATWPPSSSTPSPTSATPPTPIASPTPAFDKHGCETGPDGEKCRMLATYTPVATPALAPPAAFHPRGTRTGIAEVDAIIDAVERKDAARLAQLVTFLAYPCHEPSPSAASRQPLACGPGQPIGTPLIGIWASEVEGGLIPNDRNGKREDLLPYFGEMLAPGLPLHSVYEHSGDGQWFEQLRPDFIVTFTWWHPTADPRYDNFLLRGGGLIAIQYGLAPLAPGVWDDPDAPGWILPRAR